MMKTALSIVQSVCRRINHPIPTTIVSLTDPDELQILELLYAVCEELRAARCWTVLKRKHTFSTAAAQATYPLPKDFYSPLLATHWNTTEDQRLLGPTSDNDFGGLIYGGEPSSYNFKYRIFGQTGNPATTTSGQIELSPTPSSVVACAFEYLTRTFILPNTYTFPATPQETVTADTDLVIFDDDLVKLGLRAKLMEDRGGEYEKAEEEYLSRIDRAVTRYHGSHVGNFGAVSSSPRYRVQRGSWSL